MKTHYYSHNHLLLGHWITWHLQKNSPLTKEKRHSFLDLFMVLRLIFITENMFLCLKTDVHNICTSARPRNIRWILMFLDQEHNDLYSTARSTRPRNIRWMIQLRQILRNITTYVPRPSQEAEVGTYVPKHPISESRPFFLFFPALPALLRPTAYSPRTDHPGSPLPTRRPTRSCPTQSCTPTVSPTPPSSASRPESPLMSPRGGE
jgi:hypothetical protein